MTNKIFSTLAISAHILKKLPVFLPIIIIFLAASSWGITDIKILQKKLQHIQKQISTSKTQLSSQNSSSKHLLLLKKQLDELNTEYASHIIQPSSNIDLPVLLKDIFDNAHQNHIDIISLTPSDEKNNEIGITHTINMELNGEYQQLTNFFNSLTQLRLASNIQTLVIQKTNDEEINNKLIAKLSISVYNFHYTVRPQRIKIIRDPFHQDNLVNKADLSKWSGKELHLIGIFSQDNQNTGVAKDPDGYTYYITSTDTIGKKHAKINKITANAIITNDQAENIYRES